MNNPEDERPRRLAEALRQNLRRRKAQARAVQEQGGEASPAEAAEQGAAGQREGGGVER